MDKYYLFFKSDYEWTIMKDGTQDIELENEVDELVGNYFGEVTINNGIVYWLLHINTFEKEEMEELSKFSVLHNKAFFEIWRWEPNWEDDEKDGEFEGTFLDAIEYANKHFIKPENLRKELRNERKEAD